MAAHLSVVGMACKGAILARVRWLGNMRYFSPALCRCSRVQTASLCSSGTEQKQGNQRESNRAEEDPEGPEYIPLTKAKNPMMKIGYAWMVGLPGGIILFLLAKRQVDKNRLKQLKSRQKMQKSNEGNYEGSRYRRAAENVKLDQ
ncbi:DUF4748 domain-containing protein [Dunckerocampus dactyliophorus]|uniref:DUF4748 domain-containing protein n=1 Tax=Dunckerocampus dactyliophorus TaxID=161453 RepID=UPI00240615BF|nr:DUF4748 domain-containing protein [Dunckerocampus dactyliophorus]